jgi:hypothetical protein
MKHSHSNTRILTFTTMDTLDVIIAATLVVAFHECRLSVRLKK